MNDHAISRYVAAWTTSAWGDNASLAWEIVPRAEIVVARRMEHLGDGYLRHDGFLVHRTANVESGVTLKGVGIIGPHCQVATGCYLRGGVSLAANSTLGPHCEVKSSLIFDGAALAHLNFVGDSIVGAGVNIEAGAIVANHRNELTDKIIRIAVPSGVIDTGVTKFGALIGDGVRIGANAVIAPGALLRPGAVVGRLELVDQYHGGSHEAPSIANMTRQGE